MISKKIVVFTIINHDKHYPMYGDTEDITSEWIKDLQDIISAIPDLEKHIESRINKKQSTKRHTTLQKLRISFALKQKESEPSTRKDSTNSENLQKQKQPELEEKKIRRIKEEIQKKDSI